MSSITLSRPSPTVWQLSLDSPPDNRLSTAVLDTLSRQLDTVEAEWRTKGMGPGALVLTSPNKKFFSNGFLVEVLMSDPDFLEKIAAPVFQRLVTFPLVTVAAINGHAFAGGCLLALMCDYRIMNDAKGFMSMNEVLIGLPLGPGVVAMLHAKLPGDGNVLRDTMLGKRWTPQEALKAGLVDQIVPPAELVGAAVKLGEQEGPRIAKGAWGVIKDQAYCDIIKAFQARQIKQSPKDAETAFWARLNREKAERERLAKAKL